MRTIKHSFFVLGLVFATSCTDNPDKMGNSTPIDSTNVTGAAPATYGGDNPASPDSSRSQGAFEEGIRANTASSEDSAAGRH
jgi:hypothetical protein